MTLQIKKRKSREISIGGVKIGGENPIVIQTMLTEFLSDKHGCIKKINELAVSGCDIVRIAVRNSKEISGAKEILQDVSIAVIADIQFKHEHAIEAIDEGFHGIRINPGYIRNKEKALKVIDLAADRGSVIRIGFNSGSLSPDILNSIKQGKSRVDSIMDVVRKWIRLFESVEFLNFKISIKSSLTSEMIALNRALSIETDAPIHLGVTEAGDLMRSSVRSSIALSTLLREGIGDTIRVSITGDPVKEVMVAEEILRTLGLYNRGINIISCPTCSRCCVPLEKIVDEVSIKTLHVKMPLNVAIMGCEVNGPGEARNADLGIAGDASGKFSLFVRGRRCRSVNVEAAVGELVKEIEAYVR